MEGTFVGCTESYVRVKSFRWDSVESVLEYYNYSINNIREYDYDKQKKKTKKKKENNEYCTDSDCISAICIFAG